MQVYLRSILNSCRLRILKAHTRQPLNVNVGAAIIDGLLKSDLVSENLIGNFYLICSVVTEYKF